jgi:hypothetical protein
MSSRRPECFRNGAVGEASPLAAAQAVAREHGVACDEAARIAAGSNVLVHLKPVQQHHARGTRERRPSGWAGCGDFSSGPSGRGRVAKGA